MAMSSHIARRPSPATHPGLLPWGESEFIRIGGVLIPDAGHGERDRGTPRCEATTRGAGMATSQGIRVGIVGCGYWGSKHVRVMQSLAQVGEVVLIDGRSDRTASLLRGMPGARTFEDLPSALPEVDAVVIATPPTTHTPLALAAIAAGKHVLVEKPLATTASDARQLVDAARDAGVTLMVGHTFEHNAAVDKLRSLVQQRELGDVYNIDTARLNLGLYQSDVNVIFDLAPHDISIINRVLGTTPAYVHAWGACHANSRHEDVAYLRLFYPDL